jgi:trypsin
MMLRFLIPALALAALAMGTTPSPASAVIGGSPGTIPSLVQVSYTDARGAAWMCSGTVIAQNIVLTAGHCADGNTDSDAVYTRTQLQYNTVSVVIPAPGYDPTADYVHDAALLVLTTPTLSPSIALATTEAASGASADIYGWGNTTPSGGSGIASTTGSMMVQSDADCAAYWTMYWGASDMCALDPGGIVALGAGDSGGPLVVNGVEVGINDRLGGTSSPSIFTRVDQLHDWIKSEIAANPLPPSVSATTVTTAASSKVVKHKRHHSKRHHGIAKGSA